MSVYRIPAGKPPERRALRTSGVHMLYACRKHNGGGWTALASSWDGPETEYVSAEGLAWFCAASGKEAGDELSRLLSVEVAYHRAMYAVGQGPRT